jgi:outer membrane cobalamin receptor
MKKLIFAAALLTAAAGQVHAQRDTTAHTLDNVVVTGTRNVTDIRHLPMTISVVNRDKLTENQRVNVLPTLSEQVPGLFVTARSMMGYAVSDGAAGGISLRGLGSGAGRMMVLIDGHPQYQGIFGHSISDSYQTMMADRVEVLRGPASMLYGSNAMGGVVNIVTRSMREDGVKTDINLGAGSYGTFQGEFTNRIRSGKFYSVVAGQYGRSDNNRPSMGFEQYGGYAKLGYDFSPHWTAYADVNVTHFNSSYPGSTYEPLLGARQWITRGVASAVVENHYGRTSGAVSVYHNFGRHKINDGYAPGEQPQENYFRSNDALTGFSIYQSATFFTGNRITVGLDYQHIYGKAWNRVIATGEDLDPIGHHHENEIAGYVDFRQDLFRWLTVDAGVRVDHHSQTGTEWVPQGGLVFRMVKDGELKAMVSKGFRNPTIREMYLWRPANADLRPERMMNYELSWKQRLCGGAFSYGINLFYINGDNIIQTAMVDNRPMNVNTGAIENSGIEAEFAWKANRYLSLNGNYSFLHMHNKVLAAPEHKAYLGADYRRGRWMFAGGLQYIDGLYTQVDPTEIQENFLLLNVTAAYKALPWLNIWAKGENLLAQKYEINYGYPMPKATFMGGVNINI